MGLTPEQLEELAELPARMRAYAQASASCDHGLYQLLMRSARWLGAPARAPGATLGQIAR